MKRHTAIKFFVAVTQNGIKRGLKKKIKSYSSYSSWKQSSFNTHVNFGQPEFYCSTLKLIKDEAGYTKLNDSLTSLADLAR